MCILYIHIINHTKERQVGIEKAMGWMITFYPEVSIPRRKEAIRIITVHKCPFCPFTLSSITRKEQWGMKK